MEIVLRVSTFVEIGFLVLGRKVQTFYFVYIACAGERLLLLVVECRERSGPNSGSDLTTRFDPHQLVFRAEVIHDTIFFFELLLNLFIMRKDCSSQMMMSVEKDPLRSLPWYQCFTRVRVGPTSCATLMNCYSGMNLVSRTMVDALNLPLIEHPEPYELWWKDKFVKIMHCVEVRFTLCGYGDLVMCDVLPMHMHTCSILLGKPWTDK